jgi:hypothetical protein
VRLLADQQYVKPGLKPATQRWTQQHGNSRPLQARLTAPRTLHDRLIAVDGKDAFTLTQSLNGLAVRSPATIVRVPADVAALKIPAYDAIWQASVPL